MVIRWIDYSLSTVAGNAQFAGPEGNFTLTPRITFDDADIIRFLVSGSASGPVLPTDRILAIEFRGVIYSHQNSDGANVHGGNQTTSEWFTFGINPFRAPNGTRLDQVQPFIGVHQLSPRSPMPAPCFGPDAQFFTFDRRVDIHHLKVGDEITTEKGFQPVLWVGRSGVLVTDKTQPYQYLGKTYSPQHRILFRDSWVTAKQLWKAGMADLVAPVGSITYWHVLLPVHTGIWCGTHYAESLLQTDRALLALGEHASEIRRLIEGREYQLDRPEVKARDLLVRT